MRWKINIMQRNLKNQWYMNQNYLNNAWVNDECSCEIINRFTMHSDEWNINCTNNTYTNFTQTSHLAHKSNHK